MITFKQAIISHLQTLKIMGWELSDTALKVPHATSPDGTCRLWFRPQAVHFTSTSRGGRHIYSNARAVLQTGLDIRAAKTSEIMRLAAYLP